MAEFCFGARKFDFVQLKNEERVPMNQNRTQGGPIFFHGTYYSTLYVIHVLHYIVRSIVYVIVRTTVLYVLQYGTLYYNNNISYVPGITVHRAY